jgi:hypothetical protein
MISKILSALSDYHSIQIFSSYSPPPFHPNWKNIFQGPRKDLAVKTKVVPEGWAVTITAQPSRTTLVNTA